MLLCSVFVLLSAHSSARDRWLFLVACYRRWVNKKDAPSIVGNAIRLRSRFLLPLVPPSFVHSDIIWPSLSPHLMLSLTLTWCRIHAQSRQRTSQSLIRYKILVLFRYPQVDPWDLSLSNNIWMKIRHRFDAVRSPPSFILILFSSLEIYFNVNPPWTTFANLVSLLVLSPPHPPKTMEFIHLVFLSSSSSLLQSKNNLPSLLSFFVVALLGCLIIPNPNDFSAFMCVCETIRESCTSAIYIIEQFLLSIKPCGVQHLRCIYLPLHCSRASSSMCSLCVGFPTISHTLPFSPSPA